MASEPRWAPLAGSKLAPGVLSRKLRVWMNDSAQFGPTFLMAGNCGQRPPIELKECSVGMPPPRTMHYPRNRTPKVLPMRPQQPAPAADARPSRYRFRLRTLFYLVVIVALASGVGRSIANGDPGMFMGIGAFCYGGIVALPCYAFVASLAGLATTSRWGQRGSEVFAGLVGAAAWITVIVAVLGRWPQLCVAYSLLAVAIMAIVIWRGWKPEDSPAPAATLKRLLQAKHERSQASSGQQIASSVQQMASGGRKPTEANQ